LKTIQARAARSIPGAFKAISRAALDIETYLLPIEQQIWKHNIESLGHMLTSDDLPELSQLAECNIGDRQQNVVYVLLLRSINK
jgi:hypothetical protein